MSPWTRFALRTLTTFCVGIVFLVIGSFLLVHVIGGDPVRNSMGLDASEAQIQALRVKLHLTESLPVQFWRYVQGLAHLDLGESLVSEQPVTDTLRLRLPNSLELATIAIAFVAVGSVTIGTITGALTQFGARRRIHVAFTGLTGVMVAIPEFLLATLLVFLFAVTLPFFPVAGKSGASSFVLPAAALAIAPTALLARIIRIETVKVLASDYMRTARSKHLARNRFYLRHVLPNSLTSAITIGGLVFGSLIGGSVVVENVFGWPGIGTTLVQAIQARDYPLVQGTLLVFGLLVLLVNTLVDLVLAVIDPRSAVGDLR
jgi:peptide/nickel transport system permease protein